MFENPRRSRQARNFTTNAPKILDLKSSSEQIFSRKLPLGAPAVFQVIKICVLLPACIWFSRTVDVICISAGTGIYLKNIIISSYTFYFAKL